MAVKITGKQFNPKTIKRFAQKQFEEQGLNFGDKDPDISKRLIREVGASLVHVTFFLKSGMKLKLGIKFDIEKGKIQPDSKGIIYSAKLNTSTIPLSRAKGQDYDWTGFMKKIADFVKKKEKGYKPKPPTISKGRATDNKIPNTFVAKLAAKKELLEEKKKELKRIQKLLGEQDSLNSQLESEIGIFKKTAA